MAHKFRIWRIVWSADGLNFKRKGPPLPGKIEAVDEDEAEQLAAKRWGGMAQDQDQFYAVLVRPERAPAKEAKIP